MLFLSNVLSSFKVGNELPAGEEKPASAGQNSSVA
jgi:hypothetical protein